MGRNFDRATSTPFAEALAFNNLVINGGMDVSQELSNVGATLVSGSGRYIADQWKASYTHAAATAVFVARQTATPGTPPFGLAFPNCLQMTATTALSAPAAGDFGYIVTPIEGYRWAKLGYGNAFAQPVTLGFWVYATIAGTATAAIYNGSANRTYLANFTVNSPLTWEYKTIVIPGDQAGTWLTTSGVGAFISFCFGSGTTYQGALGWSGANVFATSATTNFFATSGNTVCITGVSVMPGTEAPTQARSPLGIRPFDQERLLCQRYLYVWNSAGIGSEPAGQLTCYASGTNPCYMRLPNIMRVAPTFSYSSLAHFVWLSNGANGAPTALSVDVSGLELFSINVGNSMTGGASGYMRANSVSARLIFDARM